MGVRVSPTPVTETQRVCKQGAQGAAVTTWSCERPGSFVPWRLQRVHGPAHTLIWTLGPEL